MPVVCPTRAMERWTVRTEGTEAVFSCAPLVEDHTAARALPRVWAGRGLGVSDVDLSGLIAALGEVMKTPAYWWSRPPGSHHPEATMTWSQPRRDHDDGFVYLTGPCGYDTVEAGCRPVVSFSIELASVRDLRIHTWTITRTGPKGHWQTAERTIIAEGRHWTVGLTPMTGDTVALMLWSGNDVAAHLRGPEPDVVRTAYWWATNLLNGRPWTAPQPGHAR
ncbi:hypothetical protein [Amycolatopsis sp. NBC_01286]|uniref:hypothetical protein n=1 Tax=Amycolatopsis sp. NBC_01286 TaxID=2903560 RepID=UPI002E0E98C3|nr:hypothetical protein OG570_40680 [Amycolatopsis sp. NBC_01286]